LKEHVLLFQQHKHSSYCKKEKNCQFNFHPDPSVVTSAQSVLAKFRKVLLHGPTDQSLDEVLAKVDIEQDTTNP